MKICVNCGFAFVPSKIKSNADRQMFCGRDCLNEDRRKKYHEKRSPDEKFALCRNCGSPFEKKGSRGLRLYCSKECKTEYTKPLVQCLHCGKGFRRTPQYMTYCSDECKKHSALWIKMNRPKKVGSTTECLNCRKKYVVTNNCQKHCSPLCQQQFQRRKKGITLTQEIAKRNCKTCEVEFIPENFNSLYCSEPCRETAKLEQKRRNYKKFAEKRNRERAITKIEVVCGLAECDVKFVQKNRTHRFCCSKHLKEHYRATTETKLIQRKAKPLPDCLTCGQKVKTHFKRYCEACFAARRKKQKNGYVPEIEFESCFEADSGDFYKSPWAVIGDRCKLDRTPSELDPADSEFADEISAFLKKGGEIKKLPVGFCAAPIMISGARGH